MNNDKLSQDTLKVFLSAFGVNSTPDIKTVYDCILPEFVVRCHYFD